MQPNPTQSTVATTTMHCRSLQDEVIGEVDEAIYKRTVAITTIYHLWNETVGEVDSNSVTLIYVAVLLQQGTVGREAELLRFRQQQCHLA